MYSNIEKHHWVYSVNEYTYIKFYKRYKSFDFITLRDITDNTSINVNPFIKFQLF